MHKFKSQALICMILDHASNGHCSEVNLGKILQTVAEWTHGIKSLINKLNCFRVSARKI